MEKREWEDLGDQIQRMVNGAVSSNNYQELNEQINDLINRTIDQGSDALKGVVDGFFGGSGQTKSKHRESSSKQGRPENGYYGRPQGSPPTQGKFAPEHNARAYETHSNHSYQVPPFGQGQSLGRDAAPAYLYGNTTSDRMKGVLMTLGGGFLALNAASSVLGAILRIGMGFGRFMSFPALVFTAAIGAGGAYLAYRGVQTLGMIKRFQIYRKAAGQKSYAEIRHLGILTNRSSKFVAEDVKKMIQKGWFVQGHIDDAETTLMTSDEVYRQYLDTHIELVKRQQQEKEKQQEAKKQAEAAAEKEKVSKEVQEVLDRGNDYLAKIRACNEAIPGEEISAKISRMELLVQKIFERAKAHPEVIPDLKKMMNYYLPTTVKLLEAYQEMENQPVQGENIRKAKEEIEQTLDTLNTAFERLLDSIFQDTAWDVSSDISVLNTMLAQEGLTGEGMTL